MNEKKKPASRVWTDGDCDRLRVISVPTMPPTRSAAFVGSSVSGVYLTAAQCREVAAHLTALADAHEEAMSRSAAALPTKKGAVIIPADGHEYIEATMRGETVRAREATRSGAGGWYAAWRSGEQTSGLASSREITPGTWKVADQ